MRPCGVVVVEDEADSHVGPRNRSIAALELVANRPIADHVLEQLVSAGIRDVVVACSGDHSREVKAVLSAGAERHGLRLEVVERDGRLELSDALRLAAPVVGTAPCIVHLASGLLGEPLKPLAARLQDGAPDVVVVVHQHPARDEELSATTQNILHVTALHPERAPLGMAGVWLFGAGALLQIGEGDLQPDDIIDLTGISERIAAVGGSFHVRVAEGWRNYRGDPLHLLELNQIALDRLEVSYRRVSTGNGSIDGNRVEGRVTIDPTASVRTSVIVGPTVIGPGACVADAYIGPYTSVGAGARIEGAEIERSIIGGGASIMHIGGRLVASVVGRDARIFRDFSLPRAFRLRVGQGTEVALC
jgi:glucose-1-phosphate thymidylyltransferase